MASLAGAVALRDDGYLITSGQALNGGTEFLVHSTGGEISEATLVGTDPVTDISVLRTTTSIAPALMASSPPEDGSSVAIIDPTGGAQHHTIESVAAVSTKADGEHLVGVHTLTEASSDFPPGSVAVDGTGAVVGIAVATDPHSPFALIPIGVADAIATEIIANGVITHVRIGVTARDPEGGEVGSVVTAVVQDGPAAVGGVFPADVIVGIGDHRITSMAEMVSVLRTYEPGDAVEIMVDRDGEHIGCPVVLGADIYDGA
jgi:S1-C subfamily serine protease